MLPCVALDDIDCPTTPWLALDEDEGELPTDDVIDDDEDEDEDVGIAAFEELLKVLVVELVAPAVIVSVRVAGQLACELLARALDELDDDDPSALELLGEMALEVGALLLVLEAVLVIATAALDAEDELDEEVLELDDELEDELEDETLVGEALLDIPLIVDTVYVRYFREQHSW